MNKEDDRDMLCYVLKAKALELFITGGVDGLCRLLSLRGFDYTRNENVSGGDVQVYLDLFFDVDMFMEIIDISGYEYFGNLNNRITGTTREDFREILLAILV